MASLSVVHLAVLPARVTVIVDAWSGVRRVAECRAYLPGGRCPAQP
jgi:hypothetical protein